MIKHSLAVACCVVALGPLTACQEEKGGPPEPVREALKGEPRPALLLTHAWFWDDADGKPRPGWARLDIWREEDGGTWARTRLEDPDSNVFHKAIPYDGGILTIGAERAILKHWRFADGEWKADTIWERAWGGRFNRLRDLEIGDVDRDGKDEIVVATHDQGVVAVIDPAEGGGKPNVIEMDQEPDTFVHEIEIGDIDGDGKLEFFATPSGRNVAGHSQPGGVVMYRWNGTGFDKTWVDKQEETHAKEVLAADLDKDGKSELFSVLEAEVDRATGKVVKPVEIRQYRLQADGTFTQHSIGTIPDRQTRFLVPGDFDGDGVAELIAPALKTGVYHFSPPPGGIASDEPWRSTNIATNSSGFEHASYATDLNGDGKLELYVAADDQGQFVRYDFEGGTFKPTSLGRLDEGVLTWNISAGKF